jgi:hypothetical protein
MTDVDQSALAPCPNAAPYAAICKCNVGTRPNCDCYSLCA